jgi:hypothetical protein
MDVQLDKESSVDCQILTFKSYIKLGSTTIYCWVRTVLSRDAVANMGLFGASRIHAQSHTMRSWALYELKEW